MKNVALYILYNHVYKKLGYYPLNVLGSNTG